MRLQLPKIYPITDVRVSGLTNLEQVRELIEGGATLIQLREKNAQAGEWVEDARMSVRFARDAGVRILINDRVDLTMALNASGVHLGQDDLHPASARLMLGREAIIGYSTHTIGQVRDAVKMPVDYIAVGPIFDTKTKGNPDTTVGLRLIEQARNEIGDLPLVAIGGINAGNVASVFAAGADSAAMIGAILARPGKLSTSIRELEKLAC